MGSNCGCNCGCQSGGQSGGYNNGGCNNGYNNGGYNNGGYNNGVYNNGGYNNNGGFNQPQVQCQCNNQLTFRDKYGNTHGARRRADETGRTWCYTYGGCPDSRQSSRFPNNPWSYQACQYSG